MCVCKGRLFLFVISFFVILWGLEVIGWGRDDHGLCFLFCMLYTGLETAFRVFKQNSVQTQCGLKPMYCRRYSHISTHITSLPKGKVKTTRKEKKTKVCTGLSQTDKSTSFLSHNNAFN